MLFTQMTSKIWRTGCYLILVVVLFGGIAFAQNKANIDSICIDGVERFNIDRGFIYSKMDIKVRWKVCNNGEFGDITSFDKYVVYCSKDSTFPPGETKIADVGQVDTATFVQMSVKSSYIYYIRVDGYRNGNFSTRTKVYPYAGHLPFIKEGFWTPAYLFLSALQGLGFFNDAVESLQNSSVVGRLAFELIAIFFIIGFVTWCCKTNRMLRSSFMFVIDKPIKGKNEADRFKELLDEFHYLGTGRIEKISILARAKLVRSYFLGWFSKFKYPWLEILGRKRQKVDTRFFDIPSVRILNTACLSLKQPDDLMDDLETRIEAEEQELRKRSFIDILWGLGVTAPLVGLFGTVTGISQSFMRIKDSSPGDEYLMANLSGGIYEALYTTICGLIVGILFMLAYYYYDYKIGRTRAIWIDFASHFMDEFKHEQQDTTGMAVDRRKNPAKSKVSEEDSGGGQGKSENEPIGKD
jgi:hypothetical protein